VHNVNTEAGGFENRRLLSSKNRMYLLILYLTHRKVFKILHKFNYLKTNWNYRATSSLSNLHFYIIFKCFLIKLCVFENEVE
jgi:hypothetical protein